MSCSVAISSATSAGLSACAARSRAVLNEPLRRLPEIPRIVVMETPPSEGVPHSVAVAVADRVAPLATERASRHLGAGRGLVALPFADAHQLQHLVDGGRIEAGGDDLRARLLLVDMAQQDRIEH